MKEKTRILNANQPQPIQPHTILDRDWVLKAQAEFAKQLICGMAYIGEPGACRERYQEVTLLTPKKVAERACDLAQCAFEEFERRGWVMPVPFYDEMVKQLRATEEAGSPIGFSNSQ